MAYPRFMRSRSFKFYNAATQGGLTFSGNAGTPTWTDVTGSDLTLNAQVGDVFEIHANPFWVSNGTSKGYLTFATMNGSTRLNIYNNTAFGGVGAWFGPLETLDRTTSGSVFYTIVAGDIVSGQVTIRLMGATNTGSRQAYVIPIAVKNLGPVDPN